MAVGQTYSPPSHAAIILSLEGVFASVASYLLLDETLSYRELSGCFLMLTAALIAKVGLSCIDLQQGMDGHKKEWRVQLLHDYRYYMTMAMILPELLTLIAHLIKVNYIN